MEPARGQHHPSKTKSFEETQAQVDEVVNIMIGNFEKMLEKEKNLGTLDERANHLVAGSKEFKRHTQKVEKKYRWKHLKLTIVLGVICIVVVVIAIVTFVFL